MVNHKQIINAGCVCANNDGIWFVHYVIPMLMFYSFSEKKVTFVKLIPCTSEKYMPCIYSGIEYFNQKVYLFAKNAKESYIYDIETDIFQKINLKIENGAFSGSYFCDGYIYALLNSGDGLLKIDVSDDSKEIKYFSESLGDINGINLIDNRYLICSNLSINGVYKIDLLNMVISKILIKDKKCSICYADYFDDKYYGYDTDSKKVIRFDSNGVIDKESKDIGYLGALLTQTPSQRIILDSNYTGDVLILNSDLDVEERINTLIPNSKLVSPYLKGCWINYKNIMYGISKSCELFEIENNRLTRVDLTADEEKWSEFASAYVEKIINTSNNLLEEDDVCELNAFLDCLKD